MVSRFGFADDSKAQLRPRLFFGSGGLEGRSEISRWREPPVSQQKENALKGRWMSAYSPLPLQGGFLSAVIPVARTTG